MDAQIKEGLRNETRTTSKNQKKGNCVNIGLSKWWSFKHKTKPQFEYVQKEQQSFRECEVNRIWIYHWLIVWYYNIRLLKRYRITNPFRVQCPMKMCVRYISLNWLEYCVDLEVGSENCRTRSIYAVKPYAGWCFNGGDTVADVDVFKDIEGIRHCIAFHLLHVIFQNSGHVHNLNIFCSANFLVWSFLFDSVRECLFHNVNSHFRIAHHRHV